jgi:Protein of unknown function (DUF4238)
MSEPRKHHYVPRFYLARFATRKQQIYQIEKRPTPRVYPVSIRDAAAVRDYHRLDWDGAPDPQGLERALAQVEDYHANALAAVIEAQAISEEYKPVILELLSILRLRVPSVKRHIESTLKAIVHGTAKIMQRGGSLPQLAALEARFGEDCYEIDIANWKILEHMYKLAGDERLLALLNRMHLGLRIAAEGAEFITGDQPVAVFVPVTAALDPNTPPMLHPEVEITLPLSRNVLLILTWEAQGASSRHADVDEVAEFNRRTVVMAEQLVFASENQEDIVSLVRNNADAQAGFVDDALDAGNQFVFLQRLKPVLKAEYYRKSAG